MSISGKLKCQPDDFVVTEIISRKADSGPFGLYRLAKQGLGTPEALSIICRDWNLSQKQIAHAGLKDRHAVTSQYITIKNGPRSNLTGYNFDLEYIGQTARPLTAQDISGNHFKIVVRKLNQAVADEIVTRATTFQQSGVANYFDSQRFGSLGPSKEFIAAAWCRKDYERALWLALAEHNQHDNADERRQKEILRDNWGQWLQCKQLLDRSHRRSIVTFLVDHPEKFKKAFGLVNQDLRRIYLSAFQSAVWNRMLAKVIEEFAHSPTAELHIGDATVPVPLSLTEQQVTQIKSIRLPLPSVRCKDLDSATKNRCEQAAAVYGFRLAEMKVHWPRDCFFARTNRQSLIFPENISAEIKHDDLHPQHSCVNLLFNLPRGSYATMVIRQITEASTGDR